MSGLILLLANLFFFFLRVKFCLILALFRKPVWQSFPQWCCKVDLPTSGLFLTLSLQHATVSQDKEKSEQLSLMWQVHLLCHVNMHLGAPQSQFLRCMLVRIDSWKARSRAEGLLDAGYCGKDVHHTASGKSVMKLHVQRDLVLKSLKSIELCSKF